ncbi:mediator of RNA polymerase II transcription subunit 12 [Drosophila guanche]|uniref:mediator of RNA polymerase II transcription subunit 12 n=1 Tax=Drosophila guanche TaxID=7266 RepID=UPI001471C8D9|nr:mediator of RNA polymerase II transcription subunit 12 [Drosophila guanche]
MSGYEQPSQQPHDDQTRKNTQKMMQPCQQTEYQNPPKKDQYINLSQNVQQPPQMPSDDHNNASKMMQENLQPNDPCDGPSPNVRLEQLKQQPQQEYRESSYENSAKKSSHGNAQNIREPPHQPHNDHKNASKMMEQNLQKNSSYEELPRKLANDQLKHQPRQQYRMSGYEQPSQQPHDDQTRKNTQKMMQPCQQMEYQNPTKTDEYVDPPQMKMEYKNSPKMDLNDQFKEQTPIMDRVLMPHDDYKNAPKMMLKHLPKQDPCEQLPQKAPNDQLKQQPPQEYRESAYENSAKKSSHGNAQNIREPPHQPHNDHKNASKMMEQNLQKNSSYEELPRKLANDQLKQQPRQQYRMSGYEQPSQQPHDDQTRKNTQKMMQPCQQTEYQNPPKKDQYINLSQNVQQMMQQPHDDQTRKNTQKMMQQNHQTEYQNPPKKDQYINLAQNVQQPPQMPSDDHNNASKMMQENLQPNDPCDGPSPNVRLEQLKQQPPQEYRESSYENSAKKSSHGNAQNIREPPHHPHNDHKNASKMMEQNLQKNSSYEELPRKLANDQLKQQPRQQYRMSGYEQPSQQPHDDQTRKNNVKMMQPCQQTEYQNPTKTDEYVDPPQKKMEYKNSPKTDPNDQFKEQTPLLYRVLMPHDDYKNAPKMMVKHLPKQCPCEQLPEKAPNDQLKQHPLQEYRVPGHQCFTKNLSHEKSHHMVQKNQLTDYQDPPPKFPVDHLKQQPTQEYQESVYHNYAKKTYHGNPQNMRQHSQQQPYDQQTRMNSPSMMQEGQQTKHQNLHKMDPFEGAPSQASQRNPLKQNPEEHWEPTYLNYDKNPQQIVKNSPKESHNHPKKNPLEGCLPRSPHDQLKKQPPEEYRVSSQVTSDHFKHRAPEVYQNSTQKPSHGFAQDIKQPSQQPFDVPTRKTAPKLLQAEYQKAAKKDSFEAPIQKTPNDHLKQQPPREHLESSYCNSAKQQLHSNLQKQPFSNATQEHAESSSSRIKTPHSRNCTKATVAPVPRARSSSRLVQQQLFTNADDCQPSHIADKAEVRCSPKCCEKHSSKMACKHEYLSTESTSTASTVISVKNADELRSLVSNELELQAVIMELSNDSKKEGILNPKQCTHDKTYKSKKMWENAYTRARADLDKVQQVDYSHTVDNIVSESVISPMIRQIQRMYIRNLRDEMALVESLELVPLLVKEVCENVDNMDQNKL